MLHITQQFRELAAGTTTTGKLFEVYLPPNLKRRQIWLAGSCPFHTAPATWLIRFTVKFWLAGQCMAELNFGHAGKDYPVNTNGTRPLIHLGNPEGQNDNQNLGAAVAWSGNGAAMPSLLYKTQDTDGLNTLGTVLEVPGLDLAFECDRIEYYVDELDLTGVDAPAICGLYVISSL